MSASPGQDQQQPMATGPAADQPTDPSTWQRPTMIHYGMINEDTAGIRFQPLDGLSNLS